MISPSVWSERASHELPEQIGGEESMKTITLTWEVDGGVQTYTVPEAHDICIGRSAQECQIVLSPSTVSRKHASIVSQGNHFYLRNLSQKNQIHVNDRLVLAPGQETPLRDGDEFRVGPVGFRVVEGPDRAREEFKIVCPTCKRELDYNPQGFCPWDGTSLSTGATVMAG